MSNLLYVNTPPTFEAQGEMGVMKIKSGDEEHTFILSFHALCGIPSYSGKCINDVCRAATEGKLILFKDHKDRLTATREVPPPRRKRGPKA